MRPEARVQAAIEVLDRWRAGEAAEAALTRWARGARYAGSKDRAAVRDHVFQALRCARSFAALGGGVDGRALMLGALREAGTDPDTVFTGEGHAPAALSADEQAAGRAPEAGPEAVDMPDWLWPELTSSVPDASQEAGLMRQRADVFVRANLAKGTPEDAATAMAQDGIVSEPHALSPSALKVTEGARKIRQSQAFERGLVELQDAGSQAVVDCVLDGVAPERVLDFCAGGGGKSLAIAALAPEAEIIAHDIAPERMKDIEARTARAGARVRVSLPEELHGHGLFDLVLCDAPCSGSGAWARAPEGKWRLDAARLEQVRAAQSDVLSRAESYVTEAGRLAYVTCSLLNCENEATVERFLAVRPGWTLERSRHWRPSDGGDGFFCAILARK